MNKKRTNGFSWPPDKAQLFSWIVIVYFSLSTFASLCLSLATPWIYIFYAISAIVMLTHITLNIVVMLVNPGEEAALKRKIVPQNDFDRTKHKHVIENQFCNICQIVVSFKTKHCKRCNKCITYFDHHCIYLNNCIGGRNYKLFILTIVSAFAGSFLVFFLGLLEFSISFSDNQSFLTQDYFDASCWNLTSCPNNLKSYPIFAPVSFNSWRVFIFINMILALIVCILIGYLICYHIFLTVNKMTTYEHTVRIKFKMDEKRRNRDKITTQSSAPSVPPLNGTTTSTSRNHNPETQISKAQSIHSTESAVSNGNGNIKQLSNGVHKLPVITEPPSMTSENENSKNNANTVKKARSNSLSSSKNKNTTNNGPSTTSASATNVKRQSTKKELNHFSNKAYDEFIPSTYEDDEVENSNTHSGYFQLAEPMHDYYQRGEQGSPSFSALHTLPNGSTKPIIIGARPPPTTDLTCVNMNGANQAYVITTGSGAADDSYSQLPSNRSDVTSTTASLAPIATTTNHHRPRNRSPRNQRQQQPPRLLLPADWNKPADELDDDDVIVGGSSSALRKAQFA